MVTLYNGDTLRFDCSITHVGAAYQGARMYAALGNQSALGFDEKLAAWMDFDVVADPTPKQYPVLVDLLIKNVGTPLFGEGFYEAYVKLISIPGPDQFWYGPLNDIELLTGEAEFSNLAVAYRKA